MNTLFLFPGFCRRTEWFIERDSGGDYAVYQVHNQKNLNQCCSVIHPCTYGKTYVETGVISELVIKCVRWAIARQGAFYIYGNFFEKFFDFSIFPGKMTVHATKGAVECFRERLSGGREVISLEADKAGTGYCAKEIQ